MVYQDIKNGRSSLLGNAPNTRLVSDRKITTSYRMEYENLVKKESDGQGITFKDSLKDISLRNLNNREQTRSQLMQRKGLNEGLNHSEDYLSVGDEVPNRSSQSHNKSDKSSRKTKSHTNKIMSSTIDFKKLDIINQMIVNVSNASNFSQVIEAALVNIGKMMNCRVGQVILIK